MEPTGHPNDARELLAEVADELGEVDAVAGPTTTEYRRGGTLFAATDASGTHLRLGGEIAEAAARTPATSISSRGSDWVKFSPPTLDDHAMDRLEAWFRVAWRAATGQRQT